MLLEHMFDRLGVIMMDIDLATCAAGPRLAKLLDRIDVSRLDEDQVLSYVAAVRRQQAWTDAQLVQASARFAEVRDTLEPRGIPGEEKLVPYGGEGSPLCGTQAPDDLGPDLRLSRHSAQRLIADSLDLMYRLTPVWMAHGRWKVQQPFRGIFVWLSPAGRIFVVDGRETVALAA